MVRKALVVDPDPGVAKQVAQFMAGRGFHTEFVLPDDVESGRVWIKLSDPELVLLIVDPTVAGGRGIDLLRDAGRANPSVEVVAMAESRTAEQVVRAFRAGASDFLCKPLDMDELALVVSRIDGLHQTFSQYLEYRRAIEVYDACRSLSACLEVDELSRFVPDLFARLLNTDGVLVLLDTDEGVLRPMVRVGLDYSQAEWYIETIAAMESPPESGTAQDLATMGLKGPPGLEGSHALVIPSLVENAGLGVVVLIRHEDKGAFTGDEVTAALFLGRQTFVSVRNAEVFEHVHSLNYVDDMTGLYNHRYLQVLLDRMVSDVHSLPFALFFIDLDRFKLVNDRYGHHTGRQVLIEVGKMLVRATRDTDVVVRYGGDEFVVVMPHTGAAGGLVTVQRLRDAGTDTLCTTGDQRYFCA